VVSESTESAGLAETVDALQRFAPGAEIVALARGETAVAGVTVP
jgi:hypothetical protein